MSQGPTYLDCCCALNVYATGRMEEILAANGHGGARPFAIAEHVARYEALYVGAPDEEREAVELDGCIESGMLVIEQVETDAEVATFVELARELDDGEAETGALAFHRAGSVATDDGAAIRVFGLLAPPIPIIRTSALVKRWADEGTPQDVVRRALQDIQRRARFVPSLKDPLRAWWLGVAA